MIVNALGRSDKPNHDFPFNCDYIPPVKIVLKREEERADDRSRQQERRVLLKDSDHFVE
jgi:hypothetical protein